MLQWERRTTMKGGIPMQTRQPYQRSKMRTDDRISLGAGGADLTFVEFSHQREHSGLVVSTWVP